MKKTLLSMALVGALATSANAQLPIGSVAPDFTLTDIEGNTHNLYDYLDDGYTVLIDISATWCGPCWMAHESEFMKDLYEQYGPEGTVDPGKIMVLFVEGDAATGLDDLNGETAASQGDWVTGEPYPIIDDASLNTAYELGGFPTFTMICPNRRVAYSVAGYGSAMAATDFWTAYVDECPIKVTGTNVGTINVNTANNVCNGSSTELKAEIQNLGTTNLTSATITAKVGEEVIATTTWTGSLTTYGAAIVDLGDYSFTAPNTVVKYEATTTGDAEMTDNTKTQGVAAPSSDYRTWLLEVKTDQYPGEISWKVRNAAGTVVYSHDYAAGPGSGGAGGEDAAKEFSYTLNLDEGQCYTIEVKDDYGDGLYGVEAAADTGYIRVKDGAGGMIYNFGAGYGTGYDIIAKSGSTVDIENVVVVNETRVYPNPAENTLNVSLTLLKNTSVDFNIINVVGQQASSMVTKEVSAGTTTTQLNTANLSAGIYFLNIVTPEGTLQHKFVKK